MEPSDFTEVTIARARQLLKEHGEFINRVDFGNAKQHLYAVEDFYVEFIDYQDDSYDIYAYYDNDYRLDKFLRKVNLSDYL